MTSAEGACCIPAPPSAQASSGSAAKWDGLDVYFASPSANSTRAVILATDIYGIDVPQTRKVADFFAEHGIMCVIPDILKNDALGANSTMEFIVHTWLPKHPAAAEGATILKIGEYLKTHYAITSLGVMGFCWGAKAAINSRGDPVKAVVMCHPSFVTKEEVLGSTAPVCILAAEIDQLSPPPLIEEFKAAMEADPRLGPVSKVKFFPGMKHGWTVRYDPENEVEVRAAAEAHHDALDFFKKHL